MVAAKIANLEQGVRTDLESSENLQKVLRAAAEKLNLSECTVNSLHSIRKIYRVVVGLESKAYERFLCEEIFM